MAFTASKKYNPAAGISIEIIFTVNDDLRFYEDWIYLYVPCKYDVKVTNSGSTSYTVPTAIFEMDIHWPDGVMNIVWPDSDSPVTVPAGGTVSGSITSFSAVVYRDASAVVGPAVLLSPYTFNGNFDGFGVQIHDVRPCALMVMRDDQRTRISKCYCNVNGTWESVRDIYVNYNGTWEILT